MQFPGMEAYGRPRTDLPAPQPVADRDPLADANAPRPAPSVGDPNHPPMFMSSREIKQHRAAWPGDFDQVEDYDDETGEWDTRPETVDELWDRKVEESTWEGLHDSLRSGEPVNKAVKLTDEHIVDGHHRVAAMHDVGRADDLVPVKHYPSFQEAHAYRQIFGGNKSWSLADQEVQEGVNAFGKSLDVPLQSNLAHLLPGDAPEHPANRTQPGPAGANFHRRDWPVQPDDGRTFPAMTRQGRNPAPFHPGPGDNPEWGTDGYYPFPEGAGPATTEYLQGLNLRNEALDRAGRLGDPGGPHARWLDTAWRNEHVEYRLGNRKERPRPSEARPPEGLDLMQRVEEYQKPRNFNRTRHQQ